MTRYRRKSTFIADLSRTPIHHQAEVVTKELREMVGRRDSYILFLGMPRYCLQLKDLVILGESILERLDKERGN